MIRKFPIYQGVWPPNIPSPFISNGNAYEVLRSSAPLGITVVYPVNDKFSLRVFETTYLVEAAKRGFILGNVPYSSQKEN